MWAKWCLGCYDPSRRSSRSTDSPPVLKSANGSSTDVTYDKLFNSTKKNSGNNHPGDVKATKEIRVLEVWNSSTQTDRQIPVVADKLISVRLGHRQPSNLPTRHHEADDNPLPHHSSTQPTASGSSRPIWTLQDIFSSTVKQPINSASGKKLTFLPVTEDIVPVPPKEKPEFYTHDRLNDHPNHQQSFFLPRIHTDPNSYTAGQQGDLTGLTQSKSFPIRRGSMIVRGGRTTTLATALPDALPLSVGVEGFIVTPFAQVLVSMQRIRNAFIRLTLAQSSNRFSVISSAVPEPSHADVIGRDSEEYKSIANETLEELEWCLKQLENIQTKRPVSDMTFSKFKRLLNQELNSFGESDKSRNEISAYICKTFLEDEKDAEANQEIEQMLEQRRSSGQSYGSSTGGTQEPVRSPTASGNRQQISFNRILEYNASNAVVRTKEVIDPGTAVKSSSQYLEIGKTQPVKTESYESVEGPSTKNEMLTPNPLPKHGIETLHNAELEEQFTKYIDKWGADIFEIDRISQGHALTTTAYRIFKNRGLLQTFTIDPSTFVRYLLKLETNYHPDVSYHNALHAADVLQTSHYLLQAETLEDVFSELEIFAVLFASAIHDVDHPGLTNQYLINTGHDLALQYNDLSVLENHHLYVGFKILNEPGCDILEGWATKKRQTFRRMVIELVLATDMSKHMSLLADLRTMVETKKVSGSGVLNLDNFADRIQILQNMIHCADLSNSAKPLALNRKWTSRLMEEFFRQGDKERSLNLEISPMCDRESVAIDSSQVSFIDFVAHPLLESWCDLVHPAAQEILDILEDNRNWYQTQAECRKTMAGTGKNRPLLATAEEDDEEEVAP